MRKLAIMIIMLCTFLSSNAQQTTTGKPLEEGKGYRIDKPGTITFTVGVQIKGKVEKPQVMIFLPKEKPFYKNIEFSYSFKQDLMEPLSFIPITD